MNVYNSIDSAKGNISSSVCAIGNFDGVHLGHAGILRKVAEEAQRRNSESLVITFKGHPRKSLYPTEHIRLLTTCGEKAEQIMKNGVENIIILDFSDEIAGLSPGHFINGILIPNFGMKAIVAVYDHAFGKNREGNIDHIRHISSGRFDVIEAEAFSLDGHPVSSSMIRRMIMDGDAASASRYLGRNYSISGHVCRGFARGRRIGFPTANITFDPDKLLPADGVYAAYVTLNSGRYRGVINIGSNPTFSNSERTAEVNIFDFSRDIYGEEITAEFAGRIRGETKFPSVEALADAIKRDIASANEFFRGNNEV